MPGTLTTRQVADRAGVSPGVIWDAVRRGELVPIPRGTGTSRGYRFLPSDVAGWLPRCQRPRPPRYTDAALIDVLRAVAARLGHPPTAAELGCIPDVPSVATYRRRFGSWRAARGAAEADRRSGDVPPRPDA